MKKTELSICPKYASGERKVVSSMKITKGLVKRFEQEQKEHGGICTV
jgi:hypothetical protein